MLVSDAIVSQLVAHGITDVFSVTGGASAWLNDALVQNPDISVHYCHHEQAAVFAAEGFARRSCTVGVAVVTLGPGASNAITGVAAAWMDSVPVLIISGQSFSSQTVGGSGLRQIGLQELSIMPMVENITKMAHTMTIDDSPSELIERALLAANNRRAGPVWIEVPADVQGYVLAGDLDSWSATSEDVRSAVDSVPDVSNIVKLLSKAQRPLLHLGQGIRLAGAVDITRELIERHKIPFVTSHNANDLLESDHQLRVGMAGIFGNRAANLAVSTCDLYIAIGTRLSLGQTGYRPDEYATQADRVIIDIDPIELSRSFCQPWMQVEADAKIAIEAIQGQLPATYSAPKLWVQRAADLRRKFPEIIPEVRADTKFGKVNSYLLLEVLAEESEKIDTFVTDMGLSYQSTMQALKVRTGQRLFTNTGLAPMGWGLPGAIGACIGSHKAPTVCLTGDGGLMMNLQELATMKHLNLPLVVIVFDNGGYLTIRQTQQLGFDSRFTGVDADSGLSFPDFTQLAASFGIRSVHVNSLDDFRKELQHAVGVRAPFLINVEMDIEQLQGPKLVNYVDSEGTRKQANFVNLWPPIDEVLLADVTNIELPIKFDQDLSTHRGSHHTRNG